MSTKPCSVVNTMKLWCTRSWSLSRLMRVLVRVLSSPVKLCITPPRSPGARRARVVPALVWRGGGRAFPNSPDENFSQKVNKKMYRAAMASIWSKLVADERLCVVESFAVESPKTKAFATQLKTMGLQNKVLLVVGAEELTDNLILASRNMKDVLVVPTRYADPLCLLYFDKVVVTKAAVSEIEEMLA